MKYALEELYAGCSSYSKLFFLLNLFHLKTKFKWSAESVNMLLKLLSDAFSQSRMIKDLGLGYEKIDACPNDCILYWVIHQGWVVVLLAKHQGERKLKAEKKLIWIKI
ncbi:hypothetical protein V2J09_016353 [Rumex salicifolius]